MRTSCIFVLVQSVQAVVSLVNLSVNKQADMSTSQYSDKWLAGKAVDGDVSQDVQDNSCAVTMYGFTSEAWWRVHLGAVYVVNSVKIYNRRESLSVTYKLSGFSLYVSDTSNWQNGTICYQHNNGVQSNPGPSDVLTVPCNATRRYVTVYKSRHDTCINLNQPQYCAQLELCEVQVLGCKDGTYGSSCKNNCSGNCLNGQTCNKPHGGCNNGCAAGYYGFRCDQACRTGFYGLNCLGSCGKCFSSSCNSIDGSCPYGCIAGWKGFYCNEDCDPGTFGANCEQECSQYCSRPGQCYSTNGTCYGGCQPGWMKDNCNQSCNAGFFGVKCSSPCDHCLNQSCNSIDGSCPDGCIDGWKGLHCNEICQAGFYGPNCSIACSSCLESCHYQSGVCLVVEKEGKDGFTNVIILIVTNVLTVLALAAAMSLFCRHVRNSKDRSSSQQGSSDEARLPSILTLIRTSGQGTFRQPGVMNGNTGDNENRACEETQVNVSDIHAYELLQAERNVTYTNI